jgi:hypothetical protein
MGVAFPFALPANGIESSNQFFLVFRDGFLMAELEWLVGFFRWPLSLLGFLGFSGDFVQGREIVFEKEERRNKAF